MELSNYLRIIVRRKWIILLTGLSTVIMYFVGSFIFPPMYSSQAILRVTPYASDDPPYTQLIYADRIMNTYIEISTSAPFIEELRNRLDLPIGRPADVELRIVPDSELLEVSVKDPDPLIAREAANTMVEMLLNANPIRDIRITVVNPANIPDSRSILSQVLFGYFALMVGLGAGTGLAFVVDNLDPRVHASEEIVRIAGLPVFGRIPYAKRSMRGKLLVEEFPFEDAFNRMRIHVLKQAKEHDLKILMVTSSMPGEGKSTIAANLAISLAYGGARVLLVDADLRRPTIHKIFNLPNVSGLSLIAQDPLYLYEGIHRSEFANLDILVSGLDSNPSDELIDLEQVSEVIKRLRDDYSFIIVDTPAFLGVVDTYELLGSVDGVLLVAKRREVRADGLRSACEQLREAGVGTLGLVINGDQSQISSEQFWYYRQSRVNRIKKRSALPEEARDLPQEEQVPIPRAGEKIPQQAEQVEVLSPQSKAQPASPEPMMKAEETMPVGEEMETSSPPWRSEPEAQRAQKVPYQSGSQLPNVAILMGRYSFSDQMRLDSTVDTLVDAGYRVNLISPMKRDLAMRRSRANVRTFRYPLPDSSKSQIKYLLSLVLAPILGSIFTLWVWIRHSLDILYVYNPPDSLFLAGLLPKLVGKPVLYGLRSPQPEFVDIVFSRGSKVLQRIVRVLERSSARFADHVLVMNQACKHLVQERDRLPEEKVSVVHYWPDLNVVHPVVPDPAIRSLAKHVIAYQGNMSSIEGIDDLLDALYYLSFEFRDWVCLVMGPAELKKRVMKMATKMNLGEHIVFTGSQDIDDRNRSVSAADVCVVPNPSNSFNNLLTTNTLMDFMAMKKPIVTYDLPEHRNSAGEGAVYAYTNDRIDLADKIRQVLENPKLKKTIGESGYSRVNGTGASPRSNGSILSLMNRFANYSDLATRELLKT